MEENQENKLILLKDLGTRKPTPSSNYKVSYGLYKCHCGKEFETQKRSVKSGSSSSCGCARIKKIIEFNKATKSIHKMTNTRLYKIWVGIITRTENEKHKHYNIYGGRGIKLSESWRKDFINFYNWSVSNGYKENLTIDRINNDKGYSENNCRWVNQCVQTRNTKVLKSTNTSGYRGVHWSKRAKKWKVQIKVDKKSIHLGYYEDILIGAKAYDEYVINNNFEHSINGV